MASLWQRWIVNPVMGLLRMGADPNRLAWSLALGVVVGVNPLLGSTTVVVLALAAVFRLNIVASQVGNHAVYPLEWLLFPVFIKVGDAVFGTEKLPLEGHALWYAAKHHPWHTTRLLWRWEWHALVVWAIFAAAATPAVAMAIEPVLRKMAKGAGPNAGDA
ncbi:MAG TPA: DUF2062 domain-containing protein [Acidobacteriaceae bacterium]|nr:DUF2062 domain-containing protein [Acidobacteriaceae bacterium]